MYKVSRDGRYAGVVETDFPEEKPLSYWEAPKGHTFTPPPKFDEASEIPVLVDGAWIVTPLSAFDEPIPTLEEMKSAKLAELEAEYYQKISEGLLTSSGIKVKCGSEDLAMFQIGVEEATATGVCELIRDYEGVLHRDVPLETVQGIYLEMLAHLKGLWRAKVLLQEKVSLFEIAEALNGIDV